MRLPFSYGLPILRRDFRLRRILAVRIWLYLLLLYRMCNRVQGRTPVFMSCVWSINFWSGPIVTLGFWLKTHQICFLKWTFLISWFWVMVLSWVLGIHQTVVSEVDLAPVLLVCWLVGIHQIFWFLKWIPEMFMVDFELNQCRRPNLLLLIRFQHEGVCEAWTPGSWLPWWII